jgi:phage terminase large subunit GpA-like protein
VAHEIVSGYPGDTSAWRDLSELLDRRWPHADGVTFRKIDFTCVDSGGHFTEQVYAFCARGRRLAIKGASWELSGVLGPLRYVEYSDRRVLKAGHKFRVISVNKLKSAIVERLQLAPGAANSFAFPRDVLERAPANFEQPCGERLIEVTQGGATRHRWVRRSGTRNEALDCCVYALAGTHALRLHHLPPAQWDSLAKRQERQLLADAAPGDADLAPVATPARRVGRVGTIGGAGAGGGWGRW